MPVLMLSVCLILGGWLIVNHLHPPAVIYSAPLSTETRPSHADLTGASNLVSYHPAVDDQDTGAYTTSDSRANGAAEVPSKLSDQDQELLMDAQAAVINIFGRLQVDDQNRPAAAPPTPLRLNLPEDFNNRRQTAAGPSSGPGNTAQGSKPPSSTVVQPPASAPVPAAGVKRLRTPILMYHYISAPPAGADAIRQDLSVSPENFKSQLEYLRTTGYHCVTLEEFALALKGELPLPEKPIVLTFDDGYLDNYTNAYPLLRQASFRGTFFIITDFVDQRRSAYVTWDQLKEMSQGGMEIASHTRDHSDLRNRSLDFLVYQLLGPWEQIKAHVGKEPRTFAYPGGFYDQKTLDVMASMPYIAGVTTKQGVDHSSDRMYELYRVRVRGSMTAEGLAKAIAYFAN